MIQNPSGLQQLYQTKQSSTVLALVLKRNIAFMEEFHSYPEILHQINDELEVGQWWCSVSFRLEDTMPNIYKKVEKTTDGKVKTTILYEKLRDYTGCVYCVSSSVINFHALNANVRVVLLQYNVILHPMSRFARIKGDFSRNIEENNEDVQ
jgi:hypothetical protein